MRISDWSSDVCSSDLLRPRIERRQGAVVVAAAVAEAVAGGIEADQRHEQRRRPHHIALVGNGNVPDAAPQLHARPPGPELQRLSLLDHHRQRRFGALPDERSEEHTSELQSLMRISYAGFCLKKKKQ